MIVLMIVSSCTNNHNKKVTDSEKTNYFDYSNSDDQVTGGIKMIPIETPKGTFNIYTKRMGNNPKMRVMTGNATLKNWDVSDRLKEISVPTLVKGKL